MTMQEFIDKNRYEIDGFIRNANHYLPRDDSDRALMIANVEPLYLWSQESGVEDEDDTNGRGA